MFNDAWRNAAKLHRLYATREIPADTPQETTYEADMRRDLIPVMDELYRMGIDGLSVGDVDKDEDDLVALLLLLFLRNRGRVNRLEDILFQHIERGFNLGGQTALGDMGISGSFNLTSASLRRFLRDHAQELVDANGDISLIRTTAKDIAWQVTKWRRANPDADPSLLYAALIGYVDIRKAQRADTISAVEMVTAIRVGGLSTYWNNGVEHVEFMTQRDNRVDFGDPGGPCAIQDGKVFRSDRIPREAQIPIHPRCRCRYSPVLSGWTVPETPWYGG